MITIKKATEDEIKELLNLCTEVFSNEQDIPEDLIPVNEKNEPEWWCLSDKGEVIGSLCLWKEDEKIHMGRFAVKKQYRNQHLGTGFAKFVLANVFSSGVGEVYLEARDETIRIMQRLGAEIAGEKKPFYKRNVTPIVISEESFEAKNGCCCKEE